MTEVAPLRDASTLTDEERHLISSFEPAVAALSALFGPGCEVVLHAFDSLHASVIKIANGHITGRQEGARISVWTRPLAACSTPLPRPQCPLPTAPKPSPARWMIWWRR